MINELIEKLNKSENSEERIKLANQILEDIPFLQEPYFEKGYAYMSLKNMMKLSKFLMNLLNLMYI